MKKYDRRFLLELRFHPLSLEKPDSLLNRNDIKEIVLKECIREQKCKLCTASSQKSHTNPFSDHDNPVTKTAETLEREVAFGMIPHNILTVEANALLNGVVRLNGIPFHLDLDLIRMTVVEPRKKSSVKTSISDWSPKNPHGQKKYGRDFLLKIHSHPICQERPKNLTNIFITLRRTSLEHTHCHVCDLEGSVDPVCASPLTKINDPKLLFLV